MVQFITQYDDNTENKEACIYKSDAPSLTQQHFKDLCDINKIVSRFIKIGDDKILNPYDTLAQYADLSEVPEDLSEAYEILSNGQDIFMSLPSNVRQSFDDDFMKLFDFLKTNPDKNQLLQHGLITQQEFDIIERDELQANSDRIAASSDVISPPKDSI